MSIMARLLSLRMALTLGLMAMPFLASCSKSNDAPPAQVQAASAATPAAAVQGTSVETEVPVRTNGGTFVVPATINGTITLDFTIDSGAADVSIPADVASTLVRSGTVTRDDFIGAQTYVLADGTEVPSAVFRIRTLKVGTLVLHNVTASLANSQSPLLLGQSFLQRMSSWSFDNSRQVLRLTAAPGEAEASAAEPVTTADADAGNAAPAATDGAEVLLTDADLAQVAGQFHRTYKASGMMGVGDAINRCYAAIPATNDEVSHKAAAFCVTLDLLGLSVDTGFRRAMQEKTQREAPPAPMYDTAAWQSRLRTYMPYTTPTHTLPPASLFQNYEHSAEQKLMVLLNADDDTVSSSADPATPAPDAGSAGAIY